MKSIRKKAVCLWMAFVMMAASLPISWMQVSAKEQDLVRKSAAESIPADATLWSGHYYKVYSTKMTAAEADNYCKSLGGYLATITSEGERALIGGLINNISVNNRDLKHVIGGRTGNFDEDNPSGYKDGTYVNTGALWDTGEKDVINLWQRSHNFNWCEKMDSAYRIFGYYQVYYNSPNWRPAGYYWDPIARNYTDTTYGFVCEWGEQIDIAEAECTLSDYYVTYDGTAKRPTLTVKYNGIILEDGYDYTYEYLNNLNVGTATVSIAGTGRFKGNTEVTFSVEPKLTLSVTDTGEVTTVCCKTSELPMEDKEYLEHFISGLFLDLSEDDADKCDSESSGFVIADDGKSAVWKASLTGKENTKINAVVSSKAGQKVQKKNVSLRPVFEIKRYQADYLLNNKNQLESMEAFITMESPGEILVKNSQEHGLGNKVDCWRTLTAAGDALNDASAILDLPFREKEMYEAILIDILQEAMENRFVSTAGEISQKVDAALKMVTDVPEDMLRIDNHFFHFVDKEGYKETDLAGVINEAFKHLKKWKCFKNVKVDNADEILKWADKAATGAELFKLAAEYMEYVTIANQIAEMTDEMQEVLEEMYKASGSNTSLRAALRELSSMIDGVAAVVARTGYVSGKYMVKSSIDMLWKEVRAGAGPVVNGYLALYKADKFVMDQLTGADKTAEAFVRLNAVTEINQILKNIYYSKKTRYKNSGDIKDAAVYLAATEMFFYTLTVDCKYAESFCDAVNSAWFSKLLGFVGANDAEELKKSIKSIGYSVATKREQIATGWIYQLEVDYPKEYKNYKKIIEEKEKATAVYQVQCPVDVEVYYASGELAASVTDHKAYWDGKSGLVAAAAGDGAEIWFYGNEDYYNIRYTGTDTGSMDITIQKYDSEGNPAQKVQYNRVPLTEGKVYTSEEDLNSQDGSYSLTDEADKWNFIEPDIDTASPTKQKRNLTVTNGYFIYNEAEGIVKSAECFPGEIIRVYTAGIAGRDFAGWKAVSGNIIFLDQSADTAVFVMPDEDVKIEAEYKSNDSSLLAKAREDAIQELLKYKSEDLYRPAQKGELSSAVAAGIEEIKAASDVSGVEAALASAKRTIDAIKTDAQLTGEEKLQTKNPPKAGSLKKSGKIWYKILSSKKGSQTAEAVKPVKKSDKKIKIPDTIKINGYTYQVTSIGSKAFRNHKKLTQVIIGKNITKIGKQAFYGCSNLKKVQIKSVKLKKVGNGAFTKIQKNAKITVPKKKFTVYKKMLRKAKIGKNIKIKK